MVLFYEYRVPPNSLARFVAEKLPTFRPVLVLNGLIYFFTAGKTGNNFTCFLAFVVTLLRAIFTPSPSKPIWFYVELFVACEAIDYRHKIIL
jgi:hypothetical protein